MIDVDIERAAQAAAKRFSETIAAAWEETLAADYQVAVSSLSPTRDCWNGLTRSNLPIFRNLRLKTPPYAPPIRGRHN